MKGIAPSSNTFTVLLAAIHPSPDRFTIDLSP